jgi:hypothetical protein
MRSLASVKTVTTFSVATNEYAGNGKERAEFHSIVTWVSSIVIEVARRQGLTRRVV